MVDIRSIQVLDYATTGPEGKACSEKFLEVFGLRTLFPLFLRTPGKAKRKVRLHSHPSFSRRSQA